MSTTPESILSEFKQNNYRNVLFVSGEEPFYIDRITDYVEKNALDESQKGFNQIILYGKDVDVNAVLTNARRFPMMSEKQVVIVKEAQEIKDIGKEEGGKRLQEYFENPTQSTILVFAHKKKLDGRKAFGKMLKSKGMLVESEKIKDWKLPDWISDHVQKLGHSIDPKAVLMLAEHVGNNLSRLSNEIDKLLLNFDGKVQITPDVVDKYVGISKEYNVFELQNALMARDVVKANKILTFFESDPKSNPIIPVIALIHQMFTRLILVHSAKSGSEKEIAAKLRVNPYFVKDYMRAAKIYTMGHVVKCVHHIRKADLKAKGVENNTGSDHDILRELVYLLMHANAPTADA